MNASFIDAERFTKKVNKFRVRFQGEWKITNWRAFNFSGNVNSDSSIQRDNFYLKISKFCTWNHRTTRNTSMRTERVRGRPFDPDRWGGGRAWHFWSGQIIYFHHGLGQKIYFRIFIFNRNKFFKKQKKKVAGMFWYCFFQYLCV